MPDLTFDYPIPFDKGVGFNQELAPDPSAGFALGITAAQDDLQVIAADTPDAVVMAGDSPEMDVTPASDVALSAATSDGDSRLTSDSDVTLHVEVKQ